MEIHLDKIRVETTPTGIVVTVPRKVGKDIALVLNGPRGPQLVTDLLKALEPHFPIGDQKTTPISVIVTTTGFTWQAGYSPNQNTPVFLTLRPIEIPGIHYLLEADRARELGKALIELADKADAMRTKN